MKKVIYIVIISLPIVIIFFVIIYIYASISVLESLSESFINENHCTRVCSENGTDTIFVKSHMWGGVTDYHNVTVITTQDGLLSEIITDNKYFLKLEGFEPIVYKCEGTRIIFYSNSIFKDTSCVKGITEIVFRGASRYFIQSTIMDIENGKEEEYQYICWE